MNNVGENFFSSPIDPFDLSKDWGRSDDDQRHRFVFTGGVNTSMEPASDAWEMLTHGFQFSSMLQAYSALPFNITSGVTTVQGTAGRPMVDGEFIPRNAGEGSDFFSMSLRVSRSFRDRRPRAPRGPGRGVQPDESDEQADEKHEFRLGRLSDKSVADVRPDHGRWRSAHVAVRRAGEILDMSCRIDTIEMQIYDSRPIAGAWSARVNDVGGCRVWRTATAGAARGAGSTEPSRIVLGVPGRSNTAVSVAAFGKTVAAVWTASTDTRRHLHQRQHGRRRDVRGARARQ